MSVDEILQSLNKLSVSDRNKIMQHLRALNELTVSAESGIDILRTICDVLKSKGAEFVSVSMLKQTHIYKAKTRLFKDKATGLTEYLNKATTNVTEQRAILRIGVELLYRDLKDRGIPVSANFMMVNIHRIPSLINRAFPGYCEYGLLQKIVRR